MSSMEDEYGYKLNRAKEERYARRRGFYWLPCVICGFARGGHEGVEPSIPVAGARSSRMSVCRRHPAAPADLEYVQAHVRPTVKEKS